MPIYLNYQGVAGSSAGSSHKGWIDIYSWSFGATQSSGGSGGSRGGGAGKVSLSELQITKVSDIKGVRGRYEIVVTKPTDASSHNLFKGKRFEISIVFADGGTGGLPRPRHTLNLSDAVITDIEFSHGSEELTLSFSDYYFNGAWNVPPEMVSLITAPFHQV